MEGRRKMKFGVVGTNWITEKLINAGRQLEDFELVAVYSRTEEKAKEFSKKYNIQYIFTNLEEMAKSDKIDAVYIATPNSFHSSQSIIFLKNKKAVLCEKPVTSNLKELEEVIKVSKENNTLFMEAMKTTFIPTYFKLKENLHKIGEIKRVFLNNCGRSSQYDDYLKGIVHNGFKPEYSNGALLDIGVYPLFFAISLFGEPKEISASGLILDNPNGEKGIDGQGILNLFYNKMDINILFSKIVTSYLPYEIMGEKGAFWIEHGSEMDKLYFIDGKTKEKIDLTEKRKDNAMFYEIEHFINLFKNKKIESPINNFELSKSVMKILDKAREQIGIKFLSD